MLFCSSIGIGHLFSLHNESIANLIQIEAENTFMFGQMSPGALWSHLILYRRKAPQIGPNDGAAIMTNFPISQGDSNVINAFGEREGRMHVKISSSDFLKIFFN